MIETKQIQVYDNENFFGLLELWQYEQLKHDNYFNPYAAKLVITVDAYCVAGDTGILAYFLYDGWFCMARGDDGYWQLMYRCHLAWAESIKDTLNLFFEREKENIIKLMKKKG